jgi:hypothetical protein
MRLTESRVFRVAPGVWFTTRVAMSHPAAPGAEPPLSQDSTEATRQPVVTS